MLKTGEWLKMRAEKGEKMMTRKKGRVLSEHCAKAKIAALGDG